MAAVGCGGEDARTPAGEGDGLHADCPPSDEVSVIRVAEYGNPRVILLHAWKAKGGA